MRYKLGLVVVLFICSNFSSYGQQNANKLETATFGNGTMITFTINSKKEVDNFYQLALKLGATDEGLPGPRHDEHCYAYFRDLDGNKICAFSSD